MRQKADTWKLSGIVTLCLLLISVAFAGCDYKAEISEPCEGTDLTLCKAFWQSCQQENIHPCFEELIFCGILYNLSDNLPLCAKIINDTREGSPRTEITPDYCDTQRIDSKYKQCLPTGYHPTADLIPLALQDYSWRVRSNRYVSAEALSTWDEIRQRCGSIKFEILENEITPATREAPGRVRISLLITKGIEYVESVNLISYMGVQVRNPGYGSSGKLFVSHNVTPDNPQVEIDEEYGLMDLDMYGGIIGAVESCLNGTNENTSCTSEPNSLRRELGFSVRVYGISDNVVAEKYGFGSQVVDCLSNDAGVFYTLEGFKATTTKNNDYWG